MLVLVKEVTNFLFTLVVVVPIASPTLAVVVEPAVLGTTATVLILVDNRFECALSDVVADAVVSNEDCKPVIDIDAGANANIIDFVTDTRNPPLTPLPVPKKLVP